MRLLDVSARGRTLIFDAGVRPGRLVRSVALHQPSRSMRRTRTQDGSDRRGFTLVELAVVLTIASILIGVAAPRITGAFQQRDVTGVRDSVILVAARARANAMERAQTTRF